MKTSEALSSLRTHQKYKNYGICAAIQNSGIIHRTSLNLWRGNRYSAFAAWDKFSGSYSYPVPSTKKGYSPGMMYDFCQNMWSKRTQYGRLRLELLEHLIKYFEALGD